MAVLSRTRVRALPNLRSVAALVALLLPAVSAGAQTPDVAYERKHLCMLLPGGTVDCEGDRYKRFASQGAMEPRPHPITRLLTYALTRFILRVAPGAPALSGVKALTAGESHTCALLDGGTAACWGESEYGQRGDGTVVDTVVTAVVVRAVGEGGALTGVTSIEAGYHHTCAVREGGTAVCWGRNYNGQLGDGTTANRATPVVVQRIGGGGPLTGVVSVEAAVYHTCALLEGGTVVCWGGGPDGQRGDGKVDNNGGYEGRVEQTQPTPVVVRAVGGGGAFTGVTAITGGANHTCALLEGGTVACWGFGSYGQLGDGTRIGRDTPVLVRTVGGAVLTGVTSIEAQGHTTRALLAGETGACWGGCGHRSPTDDGGWSAFAEPTAVIQAADVASAAPPEDPVTTEGARLAVYPNPTRSRATAALTLAQAEHARVALYDALGREVAVVFEGYLGQGAAAFEVEVSALAGGVYVLRAVAGRTKLTKTLVIAR